MNQFRNIWTKIIQENVAHPVPRTLSVQVVVCYKTWESRRWSAHYSCHIKDLWAEKTRPCQDKQGHQKEDFMAILVWIHIYLGYTATLLHRNISNKTERAFMSCLLWCWQNGPASCIKDYVPVWHFLFCWTFTLHLPDDCRTTKSWQLPCNCITTFFSTWFVSL